MNKQKAAIEVSHLKKTYKKVNVLKDVSFTVAKGSVFALLGANGSGKTTTINIMTTLLGKDGGEVAVNGWDVARQPAKVRESISLTGQFAAVDDMLSARENLELIGQLRHVNNPGATADKLLEEFDLVDAANRRVATFSGGMRRRLDIAMSLIGDPKIIFFDEPTTGLDPQSRNAMWAKIKSLAKNGTTIFLTTQYLEEADQLADHVAILVDGKIRAEGSPAELKNILPHGQIETVFANGGDLARAEKLLVGYVVTRSDANMSLVVATNGGIDEIAKISTLLRDAKLSVASFSQNIPTLDDAFLQIIKDGEGK